MKSGLMLGYLRGVDLNYNPQRVFTDSLSHHERGNNSLTAIVYLSLIHI